ncbi:DUF6130 family protein [Cupriavidus pampae]|uniref:Copper resistance protein CopC n=1 Tax=Cupriavidus pampae TaxID=659251 RepID=A0ABM8XRI6_9BURK|nr:DUF6130 family protein [Cupriavidus pampae]CAG9182928.1 hypothetical protein LMG32289_05229 [Cupriavidus pampae]
MRLLSRCLLITALCCAMPPAQASPVDEQPPAILPLASEPSPRLVPYAPLPEPLARGVVIVQFRTEHFRVMPVFGKTASEVSPRIGHLHVTVDDGPATWAHTSEDPIIVVGLPAGPHRVKLELADPTHKILATELVTVTVPDVKAAPHRH